MSEPTPGNHRSDWLSRVLAFWLAATALSVGFGGDALRGLVAVLSLGFFVFPGLLILERVDLRLPAGGVAARIVMSFVLSLVVVIAAGLGPSLVGSGVHPGVSLSLLLLFASVLTLIHRLEFRRTEHALHGDAVVGGDTRDSAGLLLLGTVGAVFAVLAIWIGVNTQFRHFREPVSQAFLTGSAGTWNSLPRQFVPGSALSFNVGVNSPQGEGTPVIIRVSGLGVDEVFHESLKAARPSLFRVSVVPHSQTRALSDILVAVTVGDQVMPTSLTLALRPAPSP